MQYIEKQKLLFAFQYSLYMYMCNSSTTITMTRMLDTSHAVHILQYIMLHSSIVSSQQVYVINISIRCVLLF